VLEINFHEKVARIMDIGVREKGNGRKNYLVLESQENSDMFLLVN
jgi:hypothetical protein